MASRLLKIVKKPTAHGSVLDRFLVRHSNLLREDATQNEIQMRDRLFEGYKSPMSGRWVPPRYSLRRQSRLIKEAVMTDRLELMPGGPVTERYTKRLALSAEQKKFEEQLAQFRYIPAPAKGHVATANRGLHKPALRPRRRISKADQLIAAQIASTHIKNVGPYAGRGKIFKGSKHDREKPERQQNVRQKLKAMPTIIREWKQAKLEAQRRLKQALPF